jgi:hypothetical protein
MARHAYAPFEVPSEVCNAFRRSTDAACLCRVGADRQEPQVRALFKDDKAQDGGGVVPPFWLLLRALRRFVDGEGRGHLPLSGALPDMHADTRSYIELHSIFRAQVDFATPQTMQMFPYGRECRPKWRQVCGGRLDRCRVRMDQILTF